jgi:hypothetical protein
VANNELGPNPATVEILLDTTWRTSSFENVRTETLDRKAATLATFASLVLSIVATLGRGFLDRFPSPWAVLLYVIGLALLVASIGLSMLVLIPKEQLTLGMEYVRRFPEWSQIRKSPERVRGEVMLGLIRALARERSLNSTKIRLVRLAFGCLFAGLGLVTLQAAILALERL